MTQLITAAQITQDAQAVGITVSRAEILKYKAQQRESLANNETSQQGSEMSASGDKTSVRIQLLTQKLEQHRMEIASPKISAAKIRAYYEQHKPQYATEERRDVQIEADKTKAAAEVTKRKLAKSKPVAPVNMGRAAEPGALGKLIFSLSKGTIGGPVHMDKYWYVVRVVDISPGGTEAFARQRAQIREQLQSQVATPEVAKAEQQLKTTWKARTTCNPSYVVALCSNR
jgi:parvulin-like peptidyl-prolyl isomerase